MRVALTGGVASGKSTVSKLLRDHGAAIIDADLIAREVVAKGTPGLAGVVEEFGSEVLTDQGELDRPAMADRVFADPTARKRLEGIVHPLVFAEIIRQEQAAGAGVVVHDLPLLAEAERAAQFDAVLVVDVPTELQVERAVRDRGWTEAETRSRIAAQASREDRLAIATYVIDNTGTLAELEAQVDEVWSALTA